MNPEMLEDLGRWERGEVSVDDLAERHPEGEPAALAEMHTLISMLTAEPDADRGPSWERLAASLPPQEVVVADPPARRQGRLKYFLAAFVTGAVIAPGTAAADGVEMIREVTEHVGRGLGNLVTPDRPVAASVSAPVEGPAADSGSSGSTAVEVAAALPSLRAVAPTEDPAAGTPVVVLPGVPTALDPDPAPRQVVSAPSPGSESEPPPVPAPSAPTPSDDDTDAPESPAPAPAGDAGPSAGSASRRGSDGASAGSSDAAAPDDAAASAPSEPRGGDHSRSDRGNDEHRMKDDRRGGKDRRGQT